MLTEKIEPIISDVIATFLENILFQKELKPLAGTGMIMR